MTEKPLYEDSQIKVEYFAESREDHFVSIKKIDNGFLLQHGVLEELARTNREGLRGKLDVINRSIEYFCEIGDVSVDALGLAIAQAYIEEERRRESLRIQFEIEKSTNEDF